MMAKIILLLSLLFTVPCFAAVSYDATDGFVDTGYEPTYSSSDDFSICCWVNINNDPGAGKEEFMVGTLDADGTIIQLVFDEDLNPEFVARDDGGSGSDKAESSTAIVAGTWNHVCGSYDVDGNMVLYLNGVNRASTATDSDSNGTKTVLFSYYIGARNNEDAVNDPIDGYVNEVTFWDGVALGQSDIDNLYNAKMKNIGLQVETGSLATHYPMDEQSSGSIDGLTFIDMTGTSNGTGSDSGGESVYTEETILSYESKPIKF